MTPATGFAFARFPGGWDGGWHPTPRRQIFLILAGEIEAGTSDGDQCRLSPGDAALLEDTTGKGHRARVVRSGRTLIAPLAEIGWYCWVWAIERGRSDLAEKIVHTNPWADVPVVASLLADWSDPWILVTVCHFMSRQPYQGGHDKPGAIRQPVACRQGIRPRARKRNTTYRR